MQNAVIDLQNICSNVNELHALSFNSILHALPFNSLHLLIMLSDIFGSFENRSFNKKNVFWTVNVYGHSYSSKFQAIVVITIEC